MWKVELFFDILMWKCGEISTFLGKFGISAHTWVWTKVGWVWTDGNKEPVSSYVTCVPAKKLDLNTPQRRQLMADCMRGDTSPYHRVAIVCVAGEYEGCDRLREAFTFPFCFFYRALIQRAEQWNWGISLPPILHTQYSEKPPRRSNKVPNRHSD